MVTSMTGYGRAQRLIGEREISVEIKSVNHRYFECAVRAPRNYGFLEEKLKSYVRAQTARGKVDIGVSVVSHGGAVGAVEINRALAAGYLESLRALGKELYLTDDVTLSVLTRFGDIFSVQKPEVEESALWSDVRQVAQEAQAQYLSMKRAEGEKLAADVLERLVSIEAHVGAVESRMPQVVEQYRERLSARLAEILADTQIEESRILAEAAVFAEKTAVAEETVRLHSHIAQMRGFLAESEEPIGRKLDFLVQEMNREANTIGSKAQDLEVQRTVLEIKSEIEKIREQIQNME